MARAVDRFTVAVIAAAVIGHLAPPAGSVAAALTWATVAIIAALFFLHGARLSPAAVRDGVTAWRAHLVALGTSFLLLPSLAVCLRWAARNHIRADVLDAVVYLTLAPTTIQTPVTLTTVAGGHTAAAICGAALSNLLSVGTLPAGAAWLIGAKPPGAGLAGVLVVGSQILAPFAVGQAARRWVVDWVERRRRAASLMERGVILLVVYKAFGAASTAGLWGRLRPSDLAVAIGCAAAMLAMAHLVAWLLGGAAGLPRDDRIAVLFCAGQRSLAVGASAAAVIWPSPAAGVILLPLMIHHQLQVLVGWRIAKKLARTD